MNDRGDVVLEIKKDINNLHDKGYKTLFSNKDIFINLINDFTDNEWKKDLQSDKLTLVDKSYILADYEEIEADIVYKFRDGEQELIFYVLLEFQSSVDYSMPIRLLFYMTEIWRDVLKGIKREEVKKKDFKLPAIIPIVTYNGIDGWHVPKHFKEKIKGYERFGESIVDFKYLLLDVNRYEKEELIDKKSITSAIFLLDQKVDVKEYIARIATIAKAFNKLAGEEKLELKNWIRNTVQTQIADQAIEILSSDTEEVDTMVANITRTIEELKEEAIKEGIKEGKLVVARALLDVMEDEMIAVKTGLDLEEIRRLRDEMR